MSNRTRRHALMASALVLGMLALLIGSPATVLAQQGDVFNSGGNPNCPPPVLPGGIVPKNWSCKTGTQGVVGNPNCPPPVLPGGIVPKNWSCRTGTQSPWSQGAERLSKDCELYREALDLDRRTLEKPQLLRSQEWADMARKVHQFGHGGLCGGPLLGTELGVIWRHANGFQEIKDQARDAIKDLEDCYKQACEQPLPPLQPPVIPPHAGPILPPREPPTGGSPPAFIGGNPVVHVDNDTDSILKGAIIIEGDKKFRDGILQDLKTIADTSSKRDSLCFLLGLGLLTAIRDNSRTGGVHIEIKSLPWEEWARYKVQGREPGPITRPSTDSDCCNGKGTNTTIMFPLDQFPIGKTPSHVGLFHELVHAYHDLRGERTKEIRPNDKNFPGQEEYNTVVNPDTSYTENKYRECWKLPLRRSQHLDSL